MPRRWTACGLTRRSASTPTTVSHVLPTLRELPRGSSVVKKRARTPSPMMATGRPRSTWSGVNHAPLASATLVSRKYVVSTPTTRPERCRPSRVRVVFSTISALVTSTAGITRAIACASAYVRPGENFFASLVGSASAGPTFCSTRGVITTLLEPSRRSCARISCSAPLPMASMAMTDATPNRMPSDVREARSLLRPTASTAVWSVNVTRAASGPRTRTSVLVGQAHELELRAVGGGTRREQHALALREAALDDHLVVVHRAGGDLLLDHTATRLLEHERDSAVRAESLERHVEHRVDLERLDRVPRRHAGAQRRIGLLDFDLDFEHLRVGVGALLPDVRYPVDRPRQLLGWIGIEGDHDRLAGGDLADVDLIDVGDRLHQPQIGEGGDAGIPCRHLRAGRALLAAPLLLHVDHHPRRRGPDREPCHHVLHHLEQAPLPRDLGPDLTHLGAGLFGLRLVVALGLRQLALRLLVVDLRLASDRRRLIHRLLLGETLLLEPQLHGADVFASRRQVERGIEHRLLVLRFRFLQRQRHVLQLRRDHRAIELRDDVALLHHRPLRHDRGNLHLVRASLLRVGWSGDLYELPRLELPRRRDRDRERAALHARHYRCVVGRGVAREQPRARYGKHEDGSGDQRPAPAEKAGRQEAHRSLLARRDSS